MKNLCLSPQAPFKSRCYAAIWGVDDSLFLFGGQGQDKNYYNDMWRFQGQQWTQCLIQSQAPTARKGAATWLGHDGNLYIFGGIGYQDGVLDYLNDLWCFNIRAQTWVQLSHTDIMPMPRLESQIWQDNWGDVYMYGGLGASGSLADFWRFSTHTMTWKTLPSGPAPCYGAVTWTCQNHLFLCGGIGQSGLWAFNPTAVQWQMLEAPPVASYGSVGWTSAAQVHMWSGLALQAPENIVCKQEAWSYDIAHNAWSAFTPEWTITPRYSAHTFAFQDKVVIFGGITEKGEYLNDLWLVQHDRQQSQEPQKNMATFQMNL
ncbi:MAG: kelch repeat-containing protein [Pseudomonadota bacterium]